MSDNEAWYDAEIAPALADLAKRCTERGMSFLAQVEYQPGERGGTYMLTPDSGLEMQMVQMCAMSAPNVDGYILGVRTLCKRKGIDAGGSLFLRDAA